MENRKMQGKMHKEYFDQCETALRQGCYLEAVFREYAAIEGRLEALLGVAGLPCNKYLDKKIRKDIKISHRLKCAKALLKSPLFEKSKLSEKYFEHLKAWIDKRNQYIHGLYKDEIKYFQRAKDARALAEDGLEYSKKLYNEVKRLRRLRKSKPNMFNDGIACAEKECKLHPANKNK